MGNCVLPHRRTQDYAEQALDHHSPVEEGVEGLLRVQGEQLQGSGAGASHDRRGKRRRIWFEIRGSDSAIFTHSSRGFLVASAVGGRISYNKYFRVLPSAGEWTTIEVGQQLVGSKTVYTITIGGKKVFSTTNSKPAAFENVKVYASSGWYSPVSGFIRNLLIENKNDGRSIHIFKNVYNCNILRYR